MPEITGENLEDLLAYDDLFFDYFNYFLTLPVFPQALMYNRLTGAFDKVDSTCREATTSLSSNSPLYGPTDAERENMLEWARKERLPTFLRTQLFRELKLLKLLLRPLEDRQSVSRGSSRNIRGYSRATESYISSLSVSGDNSGNDVYEDDIWGELHYSALYRYQRPSSRSLSLPAMVLFDDTRSSKQSSLHSLSAITSQRSEAGTVAQFSESHNKFMEFSQMTQNKVVPVSGKTANTSKQKTRISNKVEVISTKANNIVRVSTGVSSRSKSSKSSSRSRAPKSATENAFLRGARVLSAPINYEQFLKRHRFNINDFETVFGNVEAVFGGQAFVQFDMEGISEEQTEMDMRNLEGRLKMSIQQVKENMFGSRTGFESFREFLQGTSGEHLLAFWLECENFKDTMEDFDDIENMEMRNAYFRHIQNKFKLKLTADALEQITRAATNMELTHTIFLRTQYDVLRRLRAYWVPRFLIHCEMSKVFGYEDEDSRTSSVLPLLPSRSLALVSGTMISPGKNHLSFFPAISLVHSVPVLPEDIKDYTNNFLTNVRYRPEVDSLRRMFPRQRSALSSRKPSSFVKLSSKKRFLLALSTDKLAGGPFKRYLAMQDDDQLLARLLFWEDVTEYGATEEHLSDRLLRLCHAWNIYNKYLSEDSPYKIELPEKERNQLQTNLEKAGDFVEASIFEHAKIHAVEKLEKAWIRYLKEDLKIFLDCRAKSVGESPPSTAEVIEITLTEHDLVIKRPMPWVKKVPGSTATERARRLNRAFIMAEESGEEKMEQKKLEAATRRKVMEKERKRANQAAYAKQRESKWKKPLVGSELDRLDDDLPERDSFAAKERIPSYQDLTGNKQVLSMFRKFVNKGENKDIINKLQLYTEIENYVNLKDIKTKKAKASLIAKSYLDPQGKRYIQLNNENLMTIFTEEKDTSKSEIMQEIQKTVLPEIDEVFKDFVLRKAMELDVDPRDLVTMPHSDLTRNTENEQMMGWNKRKSRGKSVELEVSDIGKSDLVPSLHQLQAISASHDFLRPPSVQSDLDLEKILLHTSRRKQSHSQSSTVSSASTKDSYATSSSPSVPKTTGRAQATREDKNEFLAALDQCATGHVTVPVLYFYKYLLKHCDEEDAPQIDKDLFFYIEVQKFKVGSHNFADEEMLKRKIQSIVECFLESVYSPTLQIDIPAELHQKTLKAAQRYLNGKEVNPTLFDDAQFHVFKDLLFYWAGFKKSLSVNTDLRKKPVTKYDKMLRHRLEKIQNYQAPSSDFTLPSIPEGALPFFNISLSEGVKFKDIDENFPATPLSGISQKELRSRKSTVIGRDSPAKYYREPSGRESLMTR